MSPAKYPHTITPPPLCFKVGTTHAEIVLSPTPRLTKTWRLEPKISNFDSSDQTTDFHRSNVHCSCFLAEASLFLLLMSFGNGFCAAIQPWRPYSRLWTVEMCLLLELCEAFIWAAISEVGNSNECIAAEVTLGLHILWRSSWATGDIFWIDWSCLKVMMMDCHFSLLIWAVLDIIWTWYFTKYGYLLYTTLTLSQHNWLAQTH